LGSISVDDFFGNPSQGKFAIGRTVRDKFSNVRSFYFSRYIMARFRKYMLENTSFRHFLC